MFLTSPEFTSASNEWGAMYALEMDTVSKNFGPVTALDRISIGVARGSFTAVVGRPGSGRSTLLRCAAGLSAPSSGTVWRDSSAVELAVPGGPGERAAPASGPVGAWHEEVVTGLGLDEPATPDHDARARLARALLRRPALLLVDEPTHGVGAGYRDRAVRLLRRLVDRYTRTVLVTTADPAVAAAADVALFLDRGRFVDAICAPTAGQVAGRLAQRR
ncbi:ATP-binding cassette domain-containing protein [Amycolatopsis lurida]